MPWRESLSPVRMERVALVAPEQRRRDMLAEVAHRAAVELDLPYTPGDGPGELDRAADSVIVSGPIAGLVGWARPVNCPHWRQRWERWEPPSSHWPVHAECSRPPC
jgi:hypothetical protein